MAKKSRQKVRQKIIWLGKKQRVAQINKIEDGSKAAYFGYQRIPAQDKADRVLQHFNSVARYYDFMNTLLSFGIHYLWKRTAVGMLKLAPGNRVLDVCGGTGDLAILSAKAVGPTGQVVLYDINWDMIQVGLHKVGRTPIENRIQYVQGNAESISFADEYFEVAMVGFGIRNVTDMLKGLNEMYRVLTPGGKMMCLEFSKPTNTAFRWLYDFYSFYIMPKLGELLVGNREAYTLLPESIRMFPMPDELSEILKGIGFSKITYRRLTNGIAVIHLAVK